MRARWPPLPNRSELCRWRRPRTPTRMVAQTCPPHPGKGWLTPHQYAVRSHALAISSYGLTMAPPTPPREMRLTMRVLGHWREICGEREFPGPSEITGERLGDDWAHCLL